MSIIACTGYGFTRHFLLNNLMGVAFCVEAIKRMSLGNYKTSAILLTGLFAYDIFMVFGTEKVFGDSIMVAVATKLDGPIKILFPRGFIDPSTGNQAFSLLGLGDIVLPGLFLSMLMRFDAYRHFGKADTKTVAAALEEVDKAKKTLETAEKNNDKTSIDEAKIVLDECKKKLEVFVALVKNPEPSDYLTPSVPINAISAEFPRPLFNATWLAYQGGLMATVLVMFYFEAAQPALLYLVPAVLLVSFVTALFRGEMGELFRYSDEHFACMFAPEKAEDIITTATADAKKKN